MARRWVSPHSTPLHPHPTPRPLVDPGGPAGLCLPSPPDFESPVYNLETPVYIFGAKQWILGFLLHIFSKNFQPRFARHEYLFMWLVVIISQGDYLRCSCSQLSGEKCQNFVDHPQISPDVSHGHNIQPPSPKK